MAIVLKLLRIIGLLALAGLGAGALTGCSAIKLGYAAAPDYLFWRLDGYLDLDDAQAARARDTLAQLQRWHRAEELPRYAALLAQAGQLMPQDMTAAQACALVAQARERLVALAAQAEGPVAAQAAGLSPQQLQHMRARFAVKDSEWREQWLDAPPALVLERRVRQMTERAEMIYGPLDEAQRAVVQRVAAQSRLDVAGFFSERQRRQQDTLQTLRALSSPPGLAPAQARAAVRGLMLRALDPPDAATRELRESWLQESCRGFAAIHASTTPAQRESAVRRLRAYQRDLLELAAPR